MTPRTLLAVLLTLPLAASEPDPARVPKKPLFEPPAVEGQILLIGYKGAEKPLPGATRSKEDARALAEKVVEEARSKGVRFVDLVEKYSEDPCKAEFLGQLGILTRGLFPVPSVEAALFGMEEGQVSDPVDTPSGYVVATRIVPLTFAAHIVIAWQGAPGAPSQVRRTKAEARARAEEVRRRIVDGKEDFEAVAKECSDDPSGLGGGRIGFVRRGVMPRAFDTVLFSLAPGEVGEVVETEQGYHVIQARPYANASQILVMFKEASSAPKEARSTREEARKKIEDLLKRIQAGEDFGKIAVEASEDPGSNDPMRQGSYGPQERGFYVPEFEDVLYKLRPGETSGVVETRFGFHIIHRWR